MKNAKFWGVIHGIVAAVFLFVMIIAWMPKDFRFWCLLVSVLLLIGNSFCLICYIEKKSEHGSSPADQAVFVPVAVTLVVILLMTWSLPGIVNYSCNKYLAAHVVVFAVSIIVQLMLLRVRAGNAAQEQHIHEKRWNRDEDVFQWEQIRIALSGRKEAAALAKKIGDEIRYSDPMSSRILAELEDKITDLTMEILQLAQDPETVENIILTKEQQVLSLIHERNDKCSRLK